MKFLTLLAAAALTATSSVSAAPGNWGSWGGRGGGGGYPHFGLSHATGQELVSQFVSLLTDFNSSVASNLLSATSFEDTSDSINFLARNPLGSVTFNSSTAFIYGQGAQQAIDLNVTAIDTITPNGVIVFRWVGRAGKKTAPLSGIDILYASNDPSQGGGDGKGVDGWVLTKVYSEFNSAEWVLQIGGSVTL